MCDNMFGSASQSGSKVTNNIGRSRSLSFKSPRSHHSHKDDHKHSSSSLDLSVSSQKFSSSTSNDDEYVKDAMAFRSNSFCDNRTTSSSGSDSDDKDDESHSSLRKRRRESLERGITFTALDSDADNKVNNSTRSCPSVTSQNTESPSTSGRSSPASHLISVALSGSRIANIKRESISLENNEVAHEKLLTSSQQISRGFEEILITDGDHRPRTNSVTDHIYVHTNPLIGPSCSPSPTRAPDKQKQCYSPSAQMMVPNNIAYSPRSSPSPTPHLNRRTAMKRRFFISNTDDSDADVQLNNAVKRVCTRRISSCTSQSDSLSRKDSLMPSAIDPNKINIVERDGTPQTHGKRLRSTSSPFDRVFLNNELINENDIVVDENDSSSSMDTSDSASRSFGGSLSDLNQQQESSSKER